MSEVNRYVQPTFGTVFAVKGVNIVGQTKYMLDINTPRH